MSAGDGPTEGEEGDAPGSDDREGGTNAVYRIEVRVVAPVQPTEVTDRVVDAVHNLFPDAEIEREEGRVVGTARSVEHFSDLLHRQEILDTARKQMRSGTYGDSEAPRASESRAAPAPDAIHFELKKLAAFQGVVNFSVGNPDELGDVEVRIQVDEPSVEAFIDAVAPPTEGGEPVR